MAAPSEFLIQFHSLEHASCYVKRFASSEASWDAWLESYTSSHLASFNSNSILSAMKRSMEIASPWFSGPPMPEVRTILGFGSCDGYCETEGDKLVVYIDCMKALSSINVFSAILAISIHELVHAARYLNGSLKSTEKICNLLVEEGLATSISERYSGFNWIHEVYSEVMLPESLSNAMRILVASWNSPDEFVKEILFYSGSSEMGIAPGTGYCLGSKLVNNWLEMSGTAIEKVMVMSTDDIESRIRKLLEGAK